MEENLFDVMLDQLYPRVADAERLERDAEQKARAMAKGKPEYQVLADTVIDLEKRCMHVNELCTSLATRQSELLDDELPGEDTKEKVSAVKELSHLSYRAIRASGGLLESLSFIRKLIANMTTTILNENSQLRTEKKAAEELLRQRRETKIHAIAFSEEED